VSGDRTASGLIGDPSGGGSREWRAKLETEKSVSVADAGNACGLWILAGFGVSAQDPILASLVQCGRIWIY